MGCTNRGPKVPCLGYAEDQLKLSPKSFIKLKSSLIVENYKIGQKLGAGAYGIVRLALHIPSHEKRAIKSINKQKIPADLQTSPRFFSEIDVLMSSDHPNIVRLYEFYEDDKYWHLVTEYMPGGELFDYLSKFKSLTEPIACGFIKQILCAVAYCHSKNIVHRDIKPENLLLTKNQRTVKIIDFGNSTFMYENCLKRRYGTSYYIAPEVLRSFYNEKCDLWSVGVIMYLLLSGKPPFPGRKDVEILQKVERGVYSMASQEWDLISVEAKDLINRLLCYNPNARISAIEALDHFWFTKFSSKEPNSSLPRLALQKLSDFHITQKLQNAVLTFIASQLTDMDDFQEIAEVFRSMDKNMDGKISKDELVNIYKAKGLLGLIGNPEKIMREVDSNDSGYIDYTEFLIAYRKKELAGSIKSLEAAFRCFDIDQNGKITAEELREIIGDGSSRSSIWRNLINEVDTNGDGELDLDEFKNMMLQMLTK